MSALDVDVREIPKVELHRHLEMSIRHETVRELAPQMGFDLPSDEAFRKQFLVTSPLEDLESVLQCFLNNQKLLFSSEVLERITYETVEDAWREGTRILELRYSPTFIRDGGGLADFDRIHQAVCDGLARAEKDFPVAVGLICTIQRILPLKEGRYVADFAMANGDSFIGLDLADNEVGHPPRLFSPFFQKARGKGLGITAHAGEADIPEAPGYVREAMDYLGAQRIGHGVQIHRDPKIMDEVKSKGIVLELCVTSNWLTRAVPMRESHPFRHLFDYGINTTINSDDPGVFDIDLSGEYQLLVDHQHFSEDELNRCNDIAAWASFIPLEKKQKVWPRPIEDISKIMS
ncbi:MAG: adenosine deaminase [Bacteriovoracales bacterium]|nr:adenosine deaminase [Bacteriovoracales bacterium]